MDDEFDSLVVEISGVDEDDGSRARVQALSDEQLTRAFAVLSDPRTLSPSRALKLIEEELRARKLPGGRLH